MESIELREQIAETISLTRSRNVAEERVLDSIIELVESWHTQQRNIAVVEARIDELEDVGNTGNVLPMSAKSGEMGKWVSLRDRIATLKQQLKEGK